MSYLIHTLVGASFAVAGFRFAVAAVRWAES